MPRNPNKTDYSGGLPVGFESFEIIEDPRTGGNKRHYFGEVIFMSVSAMLCGMNNFAEVVAFCEEQTDWLKKWIRLPNGVPQTITIDAIGTQREIAGKIIAKKAHYLLALKGNQPALHKQVIDQFDFGLRHLNLRKTKGWSIHQDREKAHGRDTLCSIVATDKLDWMESEIREIWPGLRSLIIIENQTTTLSNNREHRRQRRYYISSLPADASELRGSIRAHWGIENNCHWTLDTCFKEDANKTIAGNAAKNLATMRRIVLNILNNDTGVIKSMPQKRLRALMNQSYRERLLSLA